MKYNYFLIFAIFFCITNISSQQNKKYSGEYTLKSSSSSLGPEYYKGKAIYSYYDDADKGRIYNGAFTYNGTKSGATWNGKSTGTKMTITIKGAYKDGLKNGYWFYGYADNGTGGIALAYGLREFLVGSLISQDDIALGSIEKVWLHTSSESVINGTWVNAGETIYLTYLLASGTNNRSTLKEKIDSTETQIVLNSGENTAVGDVLITVSYTHLTLPTKRIV